MALLPADNRAQVRMLAHCFACSGLIAPMLAQGATVQQVIDQATQYADAIVDANCDPEPQPPQ